MALVIEFNRNFILCDHRSVSKVSSNFPDGSLLYSQNMKPARRWSRTYLHFSASDSGSSYETKILHEGLYRYGAEPAASQQRVNPLFSMLAETFP